MKESVELALVIPVYNETKIVETVINDWTKELSRLQINFEIHIYNDGSKDNTLEVLNNIASNNKHLIVHDKKNSGHGSTILLGYVENSNIPWIFQTDSDNELQPDSFQILWEQREKYDFLIGRRTGRNTPLIRKLISFISRSAVSIFYRKGVWDVNSPYRLMRTEKLKEIFSKIPKDTFAPNIVISGWVAQKRLRLFETNVQHINRQTGEVSIKKWKLLKAAFNSFVQTYKNRKLYYE